MTYSMFSMPLSEPGTAFLAAICVGMLLGTQHTCNKKTGETTRSSDSTRKQGWLIWSIAIAALVVATMDLLGDRLGDHGPALEES